MRRKSFTELKPEEVLMLAIDVEVVNGDRLRNFSLLFAESSPDAAKLFAGMAAEEDQHRNQLDEIFKERYPNMTKTIGQDDVSEIPEDQDLGVSAGMAFDSLTLKEALETVLHAELQAQDFYDQAARHTDQPELASIYRELGGLEQNHVQWIETRLDELARVGVGTKDMFKDTGRSRRILDDAN